MQINSYFSIVSFTSLVLYAICLSAFLHVDGYIGAEDSVAAAWPRLYWPFAGSHVKFDDDKLHDFQNDAGQLIDWNMRVKAIGVSGIGEYLRGEKMKLLGLEDENDQEDDTWPVDAAGVAEPELSMLNDSRKNASEAELPQPLFPADLFTKDERQRGAVILHIAGVVYMFVALVIVCDRFFVPSLDVIIEKLNIADDVAGTTFMAAGCSAPKLFTSVIGVFVSVDDVGIGTIVGSAVFNISFVIGMCALFSEAVLTLTWWPLFRNGTFYSISLIALVIFFTDNYIYWWEAGFLLGLYAAYAFLMRWDEQVKRTVKRILCRNNQIRSFSNNSVGGSTASTGVQPQIGLVDDEAKKLHVTSLGVLLEATKTPTQGLPVSMSSERDVVIRFQDQQVPVLVTPPDHEMTLVEAINNSKLAAVASNDGEEEAASSAGTVTDAAISETPEGNADEQNQPIDLSWPTGTCKQLACILLAPILFPLWLTLPDTRSPQGRRFFAVTFLGSIMWIAAFSYLMVWWANVISETVSISPEVMGLTFLAAGASVPLITSTIVAHTGRGDMAVSFSVGSNIFDVCVGSPLPWLLHTMVFNLPFKVNTSGMACSVLILFITLCFVSLLIACFRLKISKVLGTTMIFFYFVFVAVSLGFEYGNLECPF